MLQLKGRNGFLTTKQHYLPPFFFCSSSSRLSFTKTKLTHFQNNNNGHQIRGSVQWLTLKITGSSTFSHDTCSKGNKHASFITKHHYSLHIFLRLLRKTFPLPKPQWTHFPTSGGHQDFHHHVLFVDASNDWPLPQFTTAVQINVLSRENHQH